MGVVEDFEARIGTLIQDSDSVLDNTKLIHCMEQALEHFNKELPRNIVSKVTPADDSIDFNYPSDWDEDFSIIRDIEFPIDENPPEFLDADDFKEVEVEMTVTESGDTDNELDSWSLSGIIIGFNTDSSSKLYVKLTDTAGTRKVEIFKDSNQTLQVAEGTLVGDGTLTLAQKNGSGLSGTVDVTYTDGEAAVILTARNKVIRFISAPGTGNSFRVLYSKRIKSISDGELSKIPERHKGAFVQLCAHYCAKALAFYYANTSAPTLTADVVDYRTKSAEYESLSDRTLANFEKVALESSSREAAYGEKDLDIDFAWKEEKLFHRRTHR